MVAGRESTSIRWATIVLTVVTCLCGAAAAGAQATGPASAHSVALCHDTGASTCDRSFVARGLSDEHAVVARVADAAGNPIADVPVEIRETGPAEFTPQGGSALIVVTGADGVARAVLASVHFGTSTVVAEISPPGTPGGFRGSAPDDDECEQPAGAGGNPPAGNCVSPQLQVSWEDQHEFPECNDGIDNDGDYLVDEQDPGCAEDDFEEPFNHAPEVHWDRTISARFAHTVGGRSRLVVFGRLRVVGLAVPPCFAGAAVRLQRHRRGDWVTLRTTATNERGDYVLTVGDVDARYRVHAPRYRGHNDDGEPIGVCRHAFRAKPHRHG